MRLTSYRPEFFNNNADQGNLLVLQRQLQWRGIASEVVPFDPRADFVLLGDGSRAAMRHFESELIELVPALQSRLERGLPTLLVGSMHEFLLPLVIGKQLERGNRSSEFRTVNADGVSAYGYRNTDVLLDLFVSGAFISTTLFGPVLAKSPELLNLVLEAMGVKDPLAPELANEIDDLLRVSRETNAG